MMLLAAFLAPWMCGAAIVAAAACAGRADHRGARPLSPLFIAGAGWFAGQTVLAIVLYAMFTLTEASHSALALTALAAAAVGFGCLVLGNRQCALESIGRDDAVSATLEDGAAAADSGDDPPCAGRAASGMCLLRTLAGLCIACGLLAKVAILVVPHLWVPIRGDDAISLWLFKAKVIHALDAYSTDANDPYFHAGSNPRYPPFLPFQAAWPALLTGQWHETRATWPWLLTYVNLALMIAGGLRRWLGALGAWGAAYAVAAMPLAIVHAYRPGYADLPLAAQLAAMTLCLLVWRDGGSARMLLLAILFGAGAAILKREGPPVAGVAMLTLLAASWRRLAAMPTRATWTALAALAVAGVFIARVVDVRDVGDSVEQLRPDVAVLPVLWRHAFEWESFHLAFWLILAAGVALVLVRGLVHRWPALLLAAALFGLDVCVFLLTPQARFAHNDQTPSRLLLQSLPAVIVAWSIALAPWLRCPSPAADAPPVPKEHAAS